MPEESRESYLKPYQEAVKRHGSSFEATLWGSRSAQLLRFDIMIDLAGFEDCTVLDIGCGQGDFAARIIENQIPYKRFIGIDALPEMIEAASARNLARTEFHVKDILMDMDALGIGAPDYICFSGTLNTMEEDTARNLILAAFQAAAQGVVFNFLSNRHHARWADRALSPARRFDTVAWFDWAMTLSSRVSFTQEYLDGHDATILINHDGD